MNTTTKQILVHIALIIIGSALIVSLSNLTNYLQEEHYRKVLEEEKQNQEEELEAISQVESVFEEDRSKSIEYFRGVFRNDEIIAKLTIPDVLSTLLVKGTDNQFYLTHLLNRQESNTGSVFLDYRTQIENSPVLNIYGQNIEEVALPFRKLELYLDTDFGRAHQFLFLETDTAVYRYEIFSVEVSLESYPSSEEVFANEETLKDLILIASNHSKYPFKTTTSDTDQMLTLTTVVLENGGQLLIHARRLV